MDGTEQCDWAKPNGYDGGSVLYCVERLNHKGPHLSHGQKEPWPRDEGWMNAADTAEYIREGSDPERFEHM